MACLPAGVSESRLTLFSSIFIAHISDDSIPDMYWLIESSILLNVIMTALLLPTSQWGEIISEGAFNLFYNQHFFRSKGGFTSDTVVGGFQLEFVSMGRIINHMTSYNSSALID